MEIFEQSRGTGRTTRIADELIQAYFSLKPGEKIGIVDHYDSFFNNNSLARIIVSRLKREHNIDVEIEYKTESEIFIVRK